MPGDTPADEIGLGPCKFCNGKKNANHSFLTCQHNPRHKKKGEMKNGQRNLGFQTGASSETSKPDSQDITARLQFAYNLGRKNKASNDNSAVAFMRMYSEAKEKAKETTEKTRREPHSIEDAIHERSTREWITHTQTHQDSYANNLGLRKQRT